MRAGSRPRITMLVLGPLTASNEGITADHHLRMRLGDRAERGSDIALPAIRPDGLRQHPRPGPQLWGRRIEHRLHDRRHARHHDDVADPEPGSAGDRVGDEIGPVRNAGHAHASLIHFSAHGGITLLQ